MCGGRRRIGQPQTYLVHAPTNRWLTVLITSRTRSSADADNALDANRPCRISDGLTAHTTLTKAIKYSNI